MPVRTHVGQDIEGKHVYVEVARLAIHASADLILLCVGIYGHALTPEVARSLAKTLIAGADIAEARTRDGDAT